MPPTLASATFLQQNTTAGTALTTGSITVANGDVIVVKLGTWSTGTAMGAPTGGGQTYTSRVINAPGGFNAWVGIYTAVISGSPGTITVSSTPAASARYSMTVERWTGAQLAASPVTNSATGIGAVAASTITPAAATSAISWCSGDAQSVDPATRAYLASGVDEGERDGHSGANGVEYYGCQNAVSTSSQSYGLSAPTGQTFVIAGIEVQASGGTASTFVAQPPVRRRPQLPRRAPRAATPVRAQVNPPYPVTASKQPRRLRGVLPRRGHAFQPTPPQAIAVNPAITLRVVKARVKGLRLFRPRAAAPVPPQIVVAAPTWIPALARGRRWAARLARGHAAAPPADQVAVPGAARPRAKFLRPRRGSAPSPIPAQVVAPVAPAYPPQGIRTRLRGLRIFRGRAAAPVPAQVVVTPPAYPPAAVRTRLRGLRLFRSRVAAPAPPQAAPIPLPVHRGRDFAPRRGRASTPVPAQIVVAPPAYPPRPVRSRLRGLLRVAGRIFTPVRPQEVNPPVPPPPTPTTPAGSWYGLLSVLNEARVEAILPAPKVCPNDGEPLRLSLDGVWYCPFDRYILGDPPVNRRITGQDWGGLAGVINTVIADATEDVGRRTLACPRCGEPLSLNKDGIEFCRYDGYRPDGGEMPLNPNPG